MAHNQPQVALRLPGRLRVIVTHQDGNAGQQSVYAAQEAGFLLVKPVLKSADSRLKGLSCDDV
jgi:hypothetical protein